MNELSIILASGSPRRIQLLKKIPWLKAAVFPPMCNENYPPELKAEEVAVYLSNKKAEDVLLRMHDPCLILACDTIVIAPNGQILGKPKDHAQAEGMFKMLCGHTHSVVTGCTLQNKDKKISFFEKTYVTFGAFDVFLVYNYINKGAPFDKAGGYGIQDAEIRSLIQKVDGDFDNVVGLPVTRLEKTLKEFF